MTMPNGIVFNDVYTYKNNRMYLLTGMKYRDNIFVPNLIGKLKAHCLLPRLEYPELERTRKFDNYCLVFRKM